MRNFRSMGREGGLTKEDINLCVLGVAFQMSIYGKYRTPAFLELYKL